MAITSLDTLISALANSQINGVINKGAVASQLAGGVTSLWLAGTLPAAGVAPTTAAIPTRATTGAFGQANPTGGNKLYLAKAVVLATATAPADVQIHDRLSHMAGLSGTVTTAQTAGNDLTSLLGNRCLADCSDVMWWLEIYTSLGATNTTATITYTNVAGTSGLTTTVSIGGTNLQNTARMLPIPQPAGGIKSIQSVTLAASTLTAGNFGVTATKYIASVPVLVSNSPIVYDWAALGLPEIKTDACLQLLAYCGTTSTPALSGQLTMAQG